MVGWPVAVAAAAAVTGALGGALAGARATGPAHVGSPFGGPVAVRLTVVGRIDVDLGPAGAGGLARVRCMGATAGTSCFVERPRRR
jgi:hypothetical protein